LGGSALPASRASESAIGEPHDDPGALIRLPVGHGPWAESLPPAPGGHRVTVSFSSPALAEEHGEAVELLGYLVVPGPDGDDDVAWLLVPAPLARAHPIWWTTIRSRSDAVYRLAMGPVMRQLAAVLAPHLD
jgi:hypothetical protein